LSLLAFHRSHCLRRDDDNAASNKSRSPMTAASRSPATPPRNALFAYDLAAAALMNVGVPMVGIMASKPSPGTVSSKASTCLESQPSASRMARSAWRSWLRSNLTLASRSSTRDRGDRVRLPRQGHAGQSPNKSRAHRRDQLNGKSDTRIPPASGRVCARVRGGSPARAEPERWVRRLG
jgi:hypothetical protein